MKIKIPEEDRDFYMAIQLKDSDLIDNLQRKELPKFLKKHGDTWDKVFETFDDFHLYLKRIQMKRNDSIED